MFKNLCFLIYIWFWGEMFDCLMAVKVQLFEMLKIHQKQKNKIKKSRAITATST